MNNCKINFLKNSKDEKVLPFQFYNEQEIVTIPMLDKRPFLKGWQNIKETVHPSYTFQNIGILTGKVNGITVLDIDFKDNGMSYWKKIMDPSKKSQGNPINTPTVITANGNIHIYFKYNPRIKSSNRLTVDGKKIGWDIKNDKSIIVAPPSKLKVNDKFKTYKWLKGRGINEVSLKEMPIWLTTFIKNHQSPSK